MMTSWNGNISALLALCAGNSPVTGEFPSQRPVTWGFDVFFDLHLNKSLDKQSWSWWLETPSRSLWRHCNVWCQSVSLQSCCQQPRIRVPLLFMFLKQHNYKLSFAKKNNVSIQTVSSVMYLENVCISTYMTRFSFCCVDIDNIIHQKCASANWLSTHSHMRKKYPWL